MCGTMPMPRDGWPEEPEMPACGASDLSVSLRWERSGDALNGEVVAENVGSRACRLDGKPTLTPLGGDGQPLGAKQVVSAEMRVPPYVILHPGQRAAAPALWSGWCGEPASGQVVVGWQRGSVVVDAQGPRQPGCPEDEGPDNLSSSWFDLID